MAERDYTTSLRGVAILIIMLAHCCGSFFRYFTPLGGIGVAMFLILSGYGLNESYKNGGGGRFWVKRFQKVWIPYFILISIIAIIGRWSLQDYIVDVALLQTSYWYIGYIFGCYLVFWISSVMFSKYRILIMIVCALSTIFLLKGVEGEQGLSFIGGVLLSEKGKQFLTHNKTKMRAVLACILIGVIFLAAKQMAWYREIEAQQVCLLNRHIVNVINIIAKFPIAMALIEGFAWFTRMMSSKIILLIGTISYELYLIHMIFIHSISGQVKVAVAVVIGSILMSILFNKINNRVKEYLFT